MKSPLLTFPSISTTDYEVHVPEGTEGDISFLERSVDEAVETNSGTLSPSSPEHTHFKGLSLTCSIQ